MTIVRDEGVRAGDPRIEGSRITVFDVKRRVVDNGEDAHVVAGEYDVSLADLYDALSYYDEHRDDLSAQERERAALREKGERRTADLL
jgi:uncharacterized protein (DUF433 family)